MARGPEGKIQDKVLTFAKKRGILYKKQEVGRFFVSSGWPDVIFFPGHPHWPFFMEFKRPGGVLTPIQEKRHKDLKERGYKVYVVTSAEHGILILEKECGL